MERAGFENKLQDDGINVGREEKDAVAKHANNISAEVFKVRKALNRFFCGYCARFLPSAKLLRIPYLLDIQKRAMRFAEQTHDLVVVQGAHRDRYQICLPHVRF